MSPDHVHDIQELAPDERTLAGKRYRKYLQFASQTALWATYIYFAARLFFMVTTPEQTWKMWAMLFVEGLFACEYSLQKQVLGNTN